MLDEKDTWLKCKIRNERGEIAADKYTTDHKRWLQTIIYQEVG